MKIVRDKKIGNPLITVNLWPLGMEWGMFGAVLLSLLGVIWLLKEVISIRNALFEPQEPAEPLDLSPLVDAIKEGLREEVLGTIKSMKPPNAQDHLFGLLNTFLSLKMTSMMPNIDMPAALEPAHGEATHQT